MSEVLFVKSGQVESPVVKSTQLDAGSIKAKIGNRNMVPLGNELPPIGEASHMSDYSGPDHVVVKIDENDVSDLSVKDAGFYLVKGLSPADVDV